LISAKGFKKGSNAKITISEKEFGDCIGIILSTNIVDPWKFEKITVNW